MRQYSGKTAENNSSITRRQILAGAAGILLSSRLSAAPARILTAKRPELKPDDKKFLEDLGHRTFQYFWDHWNPHTGLVLDRARMDGAANGNVGSIAATGFGLTAFCIGAEHGWITKEQARLRAITTLRFLWMRAFHDHGWFFHFMDSSTGQRRLNSEISSIDTALLMAGVLTVQGYFSSDKEIHTLAKDLFERVDFGWMLNGNPLILDHGAFPGSGFINSRWSEYSEASILYLMAIGSPKHGIPVDSWYAWLRPEVHYANWTFISGGPLFTHQYSHAWVDFRHQQDGDPSYVDYFENSQIATYAHRDFCISLQNKFSDYGPDMWGITVSDSPTGYVNWGGPPYAGPINGTLVPCAAAGSLMFAPEICLPVLREMRNVYGDKIYQKYGFTDAFNPDWKDQKLWVNQDVVGIDVGISLLSLENLLTANVWRWFMRNQYVPGAMERVGFTLSTPGVTMKRVRTGARKG
jgi:hypothetical protein